MSESHARVETPSLGTIPYTEEEVILFPQGLIGFEELSRFLLHSKPQFTPFQFLVSLDMPELIFPVIDPELVVPSYQVELMKEDRDQLALASVGDALMLAVVVIDAQNRHVTANLRGPVVINKKRRIGKQIILIESTYSIKHPLSIKVPQESGAELTVKEETC